MLALVFDFGTLFIYALAIVTQSLRNLLQYICMHEYTVGYNLTLLCSILLDVGLATLQFKTNTKFKRKCIRMGITICKMFIWEIYPLIYRGKSCFTALHVHMSQ